MVVSAAPAQDERLARILAFLARRPLRVAEFSDAEQEMPGITEAVELGYAKRVLIGGWSPLDERYVLTEKGRQALGLPTMTWKERIRSWLA